MISSVCLQNDGDAASEIRRAVEAELQKLVEQERRHVLAAQEEQRKAIQVTSTFRWTTASKATVFQQSRFPQKEPLCVAGVGASAA